MRSRWVMPGWLAFVCAFLASSAFADVLVGTVVRISDGDTLVILSSAKRQYKVRLAGIDAPESNQPFGTRAKQSLAELTFQKQAVVEYSKHDRYGRIVGKVYVAGTDVCLAQINRGFAWHYKQYEREQPVEDRAAYALAELTARSRKAGIWIDTQAVAPWDWRRNAKVRTY